MQRYKVEKFLSNLYNNEKKETKGYYSRISNSEDIQRKIVRKEISVIKKKKQCKKIKKATRIVKVIARDQ